jgi:hypothetical protein
MVAGAISITAQAPDAAKVLADMQAAVGGANKVAAVKTLTATGVLKRVNPRGTVENETELSMELPDKFVTRSRIAGEGAMAIYRMAGFNGEGVINETDAPPNLNEGMRARLGSDRPGGAAGAGQTDEQRAALAARQILAQKKEFARLTFAMFGASYAGFPLKFTYGGEAEAADGMAHIVEATGADDFKVQLFLDAKTHLPLMMMWSDPGAGPNAGRMIERRIYYSDFKKVDGLNLPHLLRRSVDGQINEETTYAVIQINPKIDAKKFAVSK